MKVSEVQHAQSISAVLSLACQNPRFRYRAFDSKVKSIFPAVGSDRARGNKAATVRERIRHGADDEKPESMNSFTRFIDFPPS